MSKLFNRKDAAVIEYGLTHTEEEFAKNYSQTSASAETLKKAYNEINGNKTKSKIAVQSGGGEPNAPLEPVQYAADEKGNVKKVDEIGSPAPKGQIAWSRTGTVTVVKAPKKPSDKTPTTEPSVAKKPVAKKPTGEKAIKPAQVVEGATLPTGSKRDAIKALLAENAELTNKEITTAILALGYKSVYASEISNCR